MVSLFLLMNDRYQYYWKKIVAFVISKYRFAVESPPKAFSLAFEIKLPIKTDENIIWFVLKQLINTFVRWNSNVKQLQHENEWRSVVSDSSYWLDIVFSWFFRSNRIKYCWLRRLWIQNRATRHHGWPCVKWPNGKKGDINLNKMSKTLEPFNLFCKRRSENAMHK